MLVAIVLYHYLLVDRSRVRLIKDINKRYDDTWYDVVCHVFQLTFISLQPILARILVFLLFTTIQYNS